MLDTAISVQALPGYKLMIETASGRRGVFDMTPHLNHGEFRRLQQADYFEQVRIVLGAVTWPHGQDISPATLLDGLAPAGTPQPIDSSFPASS